METTDQPPTLSDQPEIPERAIVYVVTSGRYSEYSIDGVFDTRDMAQEFADPFPGMRIEEYTLNPVIPEIRAGLTAFSIYMLRDGSLAQDPNDIGYWTSRPEASIVPPEATRRWADLFRGRAVLCCICWARDAQHAIKIANERRAQLIALNQWPEEGA